MSLSSMPAVPVTTTPLCLLKLTFSRFAQQGCHQLCALFPHECCLPCGCEFSSPYGFLQPLLRMGLGHYQWRFLLPPRYALRCSCSFFPSGRTILCQTVFSRFWILKSLSASSAGLYIHLYIRVYMPYHYTVTICYLFSSVRFLLFKSSISRPSWCSSCWSCPLPQCIFRFLGWAVPNIFLVDKALFFFEVYHLLSCQRKEKVFFFLFVALCVFVPLSHYTMWEWSLSPTYVLLPTYHVFSSYIKTCEWLL